MCVSILICVMFASIRRRTSWCDHIRSLHSRVCEYISYHFYWVAAVHKRKQMRNLWKRRRRFNEEKTASGSAMVMRSRWRLERTKASANVFHQTITHTLQRAHKKKKTRKRREIEMNQMAEWSFWLSMKLYTIIIWCRSMRESFCVDVVGVFAICVYGTKLSFFLSRCYLR